MEARILVPQRLNLIGTMGHGTIPYDDDGVGKLLQKVFQKGNHQVSVNIGIGMKTEKKMKVASARGYAEGCNDRYLFMGTGLLLQPRCLPTRAPRCADERRHHHAAFVDKDQPSFQPGCFF